MCVHFFKMPQSALTPPEKEFKRSRFQVVLAEGFSLKTLSLPGLVRYWT